MNDFNAKIRDKAIQTFQGILHKYDVEVGEERTCELEELNNALELQRREFALWKETVCEPQIKLYVLHVLKHNFLNETYNEMKIYFLKTKL